MNCQVTGWETLELWKSSTRILKEKASEAFGTSLSAPLHCSSFRTFLFFLQWFHPSFLAPVCNWGSHAPGIFISAEL